jgi:hypothetical protein
MQCFLSVLNGAITQAAPLLTSVENEHSIAEFGG